MPHSQLTLILIHHAYLRTFVRTARSSHQLPEGSPSLSASCELHGVNSSSNSLFSPKNYKLVTSRSLSSVSMDSHTCLCERDCITWDAMLPTHWALGTARLSLPSTAKLSPLLPLPATSSGHSPIPVPPSAFCLGLVQKSLLLALPCLSHSNRGEFLLRESGHTHPLLRIL